MKKVSVKSVGRIDVDNVYDISNYEECLDGEGNFIVNDIVVHNCIPDYVERRDDKSEAWRQHEHPDIANELEETYGIICYQEQLQKIWQKFGGFTAPEAEAARKAVAKKWKDKLKGIEEKWKIGATKTLGKEWADIYWDKMVSFGRYAFNKCLDKDTVLVDVETKCERTIEDLHDNGFDRYVLLSECNGKLVNDQIVDIVDSGHNEVFEVEFDNGVKQYVTLDHKFRCADGKYRTVKEISQGNYSIMVRS